LLKEIRKPSFLPIMKKILIVQKLNKKGLNQQESNIKRGINMKINLLDFVPKYIREKEIIPGLPGEKLCLGRKIINYNGKIDKIEVREVNELENPKTKILNVLSKKSMSLNELMKKTKLSYDNLRWHIIRSKNSLLRKGFVKTKGRVFYPCKEINRKISGITLSATNKFNETKLENNQKNPRRKELILINSKKKKFILSSWWTSLLKPDAGNLEFDDSKKKFLYKIPKTQILIQYEKSKDSLYSTILPKEININDEQFITTLGLLLGEMRVREGDISFSNTESYLANYVLNSLKCLGLAKKNFKFSIQVNTKNFKPKHEELIKYWPKELDINKDRISNIFEYEKHGTNRADIGRIDFIY